MMTTQEVTEKMAGLAVSAELRYRDGCREKIGFSVENNLNSLITGIKELSASVSQLLSELVEREKAPRASADGEEEEEDGEEEEEEEDQEPEGLQNSERRRQPPAKRAKI